MKKRTERFYEVVVGLFMVAVLAVLVFFTVVVSGVDVLTGHKRVPRYALFADVGGLRKNDNVVMRGMTVGAVSGLKLEGGDVQVKLLLNSGVAIREGYRLSVMPTTLLGGHFLQIDEGTGKELGEDVVLKGDRPADLMRDIGEAIKEIRAVLTQNSLGDTLANFNRASASISNLLVRVENGEGTLGKLFSKDSKLYDDMQATVGNLKSVTTKLEKGESTLGKLLSDDAGPYNDMKEMMANLRKVTDRIEKGEGSLGKLLADDGKAYGDLSATLANVRKVTDRIEKGEGSVGKLLADDAKFYDDLSSAADSLKTVMGRLERGEGSLGKLSRDDELYQEVLGTLKDTRQVIDNLRDTAPITTFSAIFFGAL